ncbi:hypothetical protein D3C87_2161030 [compost metagenome]
MLQVRALLRLRQRNRLADMPQALRLFHALRDDGVCDQRLLEARLQYGFELRALSRFRQVG